MKAKKGEWGYLEAQRIRRLVITILLFSIPALIFMTSMLYFGTNKNAFTILAALSCIGVGKFAVDFIMFCRAKCCSASARDAIELHIGELAGAYDLFMTSYDKNFAISHAVCAGRSVCALTEDPECDIKSGELHIRTMLENDGFKGYTVKIFKNQDNYTQRLDDLNRLEDSKERKSIQGVLDLLKSISL